MDLGTFITEHWGDLASVAGLFIAWLAAYRATQAKEAATKAREAVTHAETIVNFSAAVTVIEEIKRLHRVKAWHILPDRYSTLRSMLLTIRGSNPAMNDEYRSALLSASQIVFDMERLVEASLPELDNPPDPVRLNRLLSKQADKLTEILAMLKREIGEE